MTDVVARLQMTKTLEKWVENKHSHARKEEEEGEEHGVNYKIDL